DAAGTRNATDAGRPNARAPLGPIEKVVIERQPEAPGPVERSFRDVQRHWKCRCIAAQKREHEEAVRLPHALQIRQETRARVLPGAKRVSRGATLAVAAN